MSLRASGTRGAWIERVMLAAGFACLAWVSLQWHEAASYQQSARAAVARFEGSRVLPADAELPRNAAPFRVDPLIGLLEAPRVGLAAAVLEGDDDRALRVAVGHLPDTPLPWEEGNAAFAAHRDTFFRPLKDLRIGDSLSLRTPRGVFEYVVRRILIVHPTEVWVLNPDDAAVKLTLITCYPFDFVGSAPQRFVVYAAPRQAAAAGGRAISE